MGGKNNSLEFYSIFFRQLLWTLWGFLGILTCLRDSRGFYRDLLQFIGILWNSFQISGHYCGFFTDNDDR